MDEVLEFKSDKATYTARAGDDLLGGGQTAAVYRATRTARAGDDLLGGGQTVAVSEAHTDEGQIFALKWLTDAVYEQRFFQEVDWLIDFKSAPSTYGLEMNGRRLVPEVYDQQRSGEQRFFVMDLAPGQPLDQLLRGQPGYLSERDALTLAEQLCRVFTCLHEELRRSYLDFQPRNVFWDAELRQIMVIDWNLLSPKDRMDVAADLRSIGALLYRMMLGALPPTGGAAGRGRVSVHERWQEVSLGARVLLQDLLEPRPGQRIEDARAVRDRLDALCQRWEKPGDDLVREAAALFKQLRNGEAATTVQHATLLDVAVCLDLAGRQTGAQALSTAMAMVRHNLEQEVAIRRQDLTALARAISFFRSGDLDTAALLFEQALTDADKPEDELQVRRWQAVLEARHNYTAGFDGAGRQQIEALLDRFQEATCAYLNRSLSPQPDLVSWRAVKTEAEALHKDIAAVEALVAEASAWPVILALQAGDWAEVPGETHNKRSVSATQAKDAIADLPYADNLWTVLGVGDKRASVTAVEDAISILEDAVRAERSWRKLSLDARKARWDMIDDVRIRRLFEESEGALSNTKPVFDLLSVVIDKGQDALALALLEGLTTSTGLTENDRRRVQAFELWQHRMQRLERFVNVWGKQVSAEPSGQASTAGAAPSIASDANGVEYSTTLNLPASWVLSELRDLSQEESIAKYLRTRLVTTATRAVQICVRETAGLEQAKLLMGSLAKVVLIGQQNKDLDQVRAELDRINLDKDLTQTKEAIEEAEKSLSELRDAISAEAQRIRDVDQRVEEHRQAEMHRIDQEAKKRTSDQQILIDQELKAHELKMKEQREQLNMLRADKERMLKERDDLQQEIDALNSGKAELVAPSKLTVSQQKEIERLKAEAAAWSGERAQLENKIKQLDFQARTSPSTTTSIGWQDLYRAYIDLESGLLHRVKTALDALDELLSNPNSAKDATLVKEARSLVERKRSWYARNNRKLEQARQHWVDASFEKVARLYDEILKDGVQGEYNNVDIRQKLAYSVDKIVAAMVNTMYTYDPKTRVPKLDSTKLELMSRYSQMCRELAQQTDDPEIKIIANSIQNTYEGWRSHQENSSGQ